MRIGQKEEARTPENAVTVKLVMANTSLESKLRSAVRFLDHGTKKDQRQSTLHASLQWNNG
jgi:hypothetical protein